MYFWFLFGIKNLTCFMEAPLADAAGSAGEALVLLKHEQGLNLGSVFINPCRTQGNSVRSAVGEQSGYGELPDMTRGSIRVERSLAVSHTRDGLLLPREEIGNLPDVESGHVFVPVSRCW